VTTRIFANLLLLAALNACGAPGSDSVFSTGGSTRAKVDSSSVPKVVMAPQAPRILTKRYGGLYRRLGEDSRFRPCGTPTPLEIFGPAEARMALHERFRFSSVWQGRNMFGQFQGAIVTDTQRPQRSDTGIGTIRTRFFIVAVDSLRTWQPRDCGGMRVP
jgi:hypothetical protein